MVTDWVHACYDYDCIFYPGQRVPTRIRFYWASPGALPLPVRSIFTATYAIREFTTNPPVGLQTKGYRKWTNGLCSLTGLPGNHYEGTAADYMGQGIPTRSAMILGADNDNPPQCATLPAMGCIGFETIQPNQDYGIMGNYDCECVCPERDYAVMGCVESDPALWQDYGVEVLVSCTSDWSPGAPACVPAYAHVALGIEVDWRIVLPPPPPLPYPNLSIEVDWSVSLALTPATGGAGLGVRVDWAVTVATASNIQGPLLGLKVDWGVSQAVVIGSGSGSYSSGSGSSGSGGPSGPYPPLIYLHFTTALDLGDDYLNLQVVPINYQASEGNWSSLGQSRTDGTLALFTLSVDYSAGYLRWKLTVQDTTATYVTYSTGHLLASIYDLQFAPLGPMPGQAIYTVTSNV